ncbi:MAG: WD40 repeat domain-containing protein [Bacteroidota bacterium]
MQRNHFINLSFTAFLLVGQPLYASQAFTSVDDTTATTLPNDPNNTTYTLDRSSKVCKHFLREKLLTEGYVRENSVFISSEITALITQFRIRIAPCKFIYDKNERNCIIHPSAFSPMVSDNKLIMYDLDKKRKLRTLENYMPEYASPKIADSKKVFPSVNVYYKLGNLYFKSGSILHEIHILKRSPDRTLIAVGYSDGCIKIFNLYDIDNPYVLVEKNEKSVHFFAWHHDSQYLAIARGNSGNDLSIWNIPQKHLIRNIENEYSGLAMEWSYDGKSLFYLSGGLFRIPLFEEKPSNNPTKIDFLRNSYPLNLKCSPEGKKLAIIYFDNSPQKRKNLLIYDCEKDKISFCTAKNKNISQACWYGKDLIYYAGNVFIRLDSETMETTQILTKQKGPIYFIDLSEDGCLVVGRHSSLQLWDLNTLQRLKTFESLNMQGIAQWQGKRLFCKVGHENNLCVIENMRGHWTLTQTDIKNPGIYG